MPVGAGLVIDWAGKGKNMSSYYSEEELKDFGFASFGTNIHLSRKASVYGAENITLGSNIRIDDFCILSGRITVKSHVHIAAYCGLFGGTEGITLCDFANISSRVCIYAVSDNFSGSSMTNPTVPDKYKMLINQAVIINKHVIVGSGSTILPGVILGEGTAVGAMSLVNESTLEWSIYAGITAKRIKERKKNPLDLEKDFLNENA